MKFPPVFFDNRLRDFYIKLTRKLHLIIRAGGATIEVEKIVRVLFGGECACSRVGQLVGDCNHAVGN